MKRVYKSNETFVASVLGHAEVRTQLEFMAGRLTVWGDEELSFSPRRHHFVLNDSTPLQIYPWAKTGLDSMGKNSPAYSYHCQFRRSESELGDSLEGIVFPADNCRLANALFAFAVESSSVD